MTDSAKWAWYAPSNLGWTSCSAAWRVRPFRVAGQVWRDPDLWGA